jgi:hypothetical protein
METTVNSTFIGFCLIFSLIPYVLPVIMPTWRWLAGTTIIIGGLLSVLWIQEAIARTDPASVGHPGEPFGILIASLLTLGFVSGVCIRALTLSFDARGVDRVTISAAGLPIAIATIVLLGLQHVW